MKRRAFVVLSGAAMIAVAPPTLAQTAGVRKIGMLDPNAARSEVARITGFRRGLASLGWTKGHNIRFELRYANGDIKRLPGLAADLVNTEPDAIADLGRKSLTGLIALPSNSNGNSRNAIIGMAARFRLLIQADEVIR